MSSARPIEVRDMRIVHETFRNAYDEGARLVRANPTPSPQRVTFLSDHVDFGLAMLHHHHESEDQLLYPLLIQRAPEQAPATERVEHQHQEVTGAIDAVSEACRLWRRHPSEASGDGLAGALEALNAILQPHLDDEEGTIVPLAAQTLTQAEWDAIGEHARGTMTRKQLPIAFGMLLEPLDDVDRDYMKAQLPAPVRILFPVLIDRPWRAYARTLRMGT
jgi:hemerythrin-like domain-containing protein